MGLQRLVATPSMSVGKGLTPVIRRAWHEGQQRAESAGRCCLPGARPVASPHDRFEPIAAFACDADRSKLTSDYDRSAVEKMRVFPILDWLIPPTDGACIAAMIALAATAGQADQTITAQSCAIHFQARAEWMRGLGGTKEAVELLENSASRLWLSVPSDWRMPTGFGVPTRSNRPDAGAILWLLTEWASEGHGSSPRPLCMEDAYCIQCNEILQNVSSE